MNKEQVYAVLDALADLGDEELDMLDRLRQTRKEIARLRASVCGHCLRPAWGSGYVYDMRVCHARPYMDCYHLVTVYHHPMPCSCDGTLAPVAQSGRAPTL